MEMYSYRFFQRRILGDIPIYNLHGHFHWAGDIGSLAPRDEDHKLSDTEDTEDTEERKYKKYSNQHKIFPYFFHELKSNNHHDNVIARRLYF